MIQMHHHHEEDMIQMLLLQEEEMTLTLMHHHQEEISNKRKTRTCRLLVRKPEMMILICLHLGRVDQTLMLLHRE